MAYHWAPHTAEVQLEIEAASVEAVFADALRALAELIEGGARGEPSVFEVEVSGRERADLLVAWLEELAYRAEIDGLVPDSVEGFRLGEAGIAATVRGHRGEVRPIVKGVTYHRLAFERADGGYRATVVFDV